MLRFVKKFAWAGLLALATQGVFGFSLLGPFDTWQTHQLAYDVGFIGFNEGPAGLGDIPFGGPMNLGEEYRMNTPVLYYAYDQSFLDYFGSNGVIAIDKAMAILNSITNVSSYSADLSELPLEATRINYRAQALGLLDVKSIALHVMAGYMGLLDPVRYTWCLRARALPPGASCPNYVYLVIKRNFDPKTWEPTSYVNGVLYTYSIIEFCPGQDYADAFEHVVDPQQSTRFFTAIASPGVFDGSFFTGVTRDDVGGLRYLLGTNNVNLETAGATTLTLETNSTSSLLTTSNLALFAQQALTNDQATLQGLYPNLVITSVTNTFTNIAVTNFTAYFTNYPYDPAGIAAHLVITSNITYSVQTLFHYTFANLFTFQLTTNGFTAVQIFDISPLTIHALTSVQTIAVTNSPYAPAGSPPITNITFHTTVTNLVGGEFVILPTNFCEISIIAPQITNVIFSTNQILSATNTINGTNAQFFVQNQVDVATNHTFVIFPVICVTAATNFNQGIERVTFVRRDFDSLLGTFFFPITNEYVLNAVTNSRIVPLRVRRTVTAPDIVFSADDLVTDPATFPPVVAYVAINTNIFDNTQHLPNLPGPGTLPGPFNITYNKVGPSFINVGPFFLDEPSSFPEFVYGSFDGTTNAPIIYPSGTSIMDFENEILMHVSTTSLPDGIVGTPYNAQLQVAGGRSPFTWSLTAGSLPPGLGNFDPSCSCWTIPPSGAISGTPTNSGTFTFTASVTDANNVSSSANLAINISP